MRVLIVDDERPARRRLRRMLERVPDVEVCGEAGDGVEALEQIAALSPDVVLLDVRMPGLDGIELATRSAALPPIIFTTAYDEYALKAFEVAAVDYLLKPVKAARLQTALERVRTSRPRDSSREPSRIHELFERIAHGETLRPLTARSGSTVRIVDPRTVTRIRAADRYAVILDGGAELVIDESLAALEERLRDAGFLRVHRAELVNVHHVRTLREDREGLLVELSDGQQARVSRRLVGDLRRRLGID